MAGSSRTMMAAGNKLSTLQVLSGECYVLRGKKIHLTGYLSCSMFGASFITVYSAGRFLTGSADSGRMQAQNRSRSDSPI